MRNWSAVLFFICLNTSLPAVGDTPMNTVDPARHIVVTIHNAPIPGLRRAGSTWRGWAWGGNYRANLIVDETISALEKDYDLKRVDEWTIRLLNEHCIVFTIPADADRNVVIDAIETDPRVASVQALQMYELQAAEYNDPYHDVQYALGVLEVPGAHRFATGMGIRIAIIDTGAEVSHSDLDSRIAELVDFTGEKGSAAADKHGTAVAGIIAANANNNTGIVGIAPDSLVFSLKACWTTPTHRSKARCNNFTLSRALGAAVDYDADIVNLSLAGSNDPLLRRMLVRMMDRGILVVGSIANDDQSAAPFPASVPGVISVVSSSRAEAENSYEGAVRAPGTHIVSTAPDNRYDYFSGNSMAAAHVTGVLALMKQTSPELSGRTALAGLMRSRVRTAGEDQSETWSINACLSVTSGMEANKNCQTGK